MNKTNPHPTTVDNTSQAEWKNRLEWLWDQCWATGADHRYPNQLQQIKSFIQSELDKAYQRGVEAEKINTGRIKKRQYENGYRKGAKAGFEEGAEEVMGLILMELDIAKQDTEMADDPDDPKVRIKYFEDLLLRIDIKPPTMSPISQLSKEK